MGRLVMRAVPPGYKSRKFSVRRECWRWRWFGDGVMDTKWCGGANVGLCRLVRWWGNDSLEKKYMYMHKSKWIFVVSCSFTFSWYLMCVLFCFLVVPVTSISGAQFAQKRPKLIPAFSVFIP